MLERYAQNETGYGGPVLVDPELLRAFANQVEVAAESIQGIGLQSKADTAADGLPGSETQWAAGQVGHHLGLVATDISKDVSAMGTAVRGAGDRYEVDDASLARIFEGLF